MSRPAYTFIEQVSAKLPAEFLAEALDDDKDGFVDMDVWDNVAAEAADQVDARLGKRYQVPFDPEALEPLVRSASLLFVLESLYLRRGFGTPENNPFLTSATAARKELEDIGNGVSALTPTARKPLPSVTTVTEPARTSSGRGFLSA